MSPVVGGIRRLAQWWRDTGIRNSTILLCVAWLAVFVLYVYVRPEPQPSTAVTPAPTVTTTPTYDTTREEPTETTVPTTSPTETTPDQTATNTVSPTTTTNLLDNLIPPFLRPETTSSAPN